MQLPITLVLLQDQPVAHTVMPRVAEGRDDVAVSPPSRNLRLERRAFVSRAGVRVARDATPLQPRRGGKAGCDLVGHHNHGRKGVREAPV